MDNESTERLSVAEVFGAGRQLPGNYVVREAHEARLRSALEADGHIVVWGEPRQGKSAAIRHQLSSSEYCVIGCAYGQRRYDIYRMLLREAGASVAVEHKRRRARGIRAKVSILSGDLRSESETTERTFDIDIANINDVLHIAEGNGFEKIVVVDDFHYLGRPAQREIVQDLKVIYEKSRLRVILVGVWADRSHLRGVYGDLAGRLDTVEIPRWDDADLFEALEVGQTLLNARFTDEAATTLVRHAQQSIGLLQSLAHAVCVDAGIESGEVGLRELSVDHVDRAVARVLQVSIGRLRWYVSAFANPRKSGRGKAQPYKGLLHALLVASDQQLREGVPARDLLETIKRLYPYEAVDLTQDTLLKGLNRLGSVHRAVHASPVLGYDSVGDRLHVVDPLVRMYLTMTDEASLVGDLPDQGMDLETNRRHFEDAVFDRYGTACAVCPVSDPLLVTVVRLGNDPRGDVAAPEFGLPLCLNHARAHQQRRLAFEPETTQVKWLSQADLNITRPDLSHLTAQPSSSALKRAWSGLYSFNYENDRVRSLAT